MEMYNPPHPGEVLKELGLHRFSIRRVNAGTSFVLGNFYSGAVYRRSFFCEGARQSVSNYDVTIPSWAKFYRPNNDVRAKHNYIVDRYHNPARYCYADYFVVYT